MKKIIKDVLEKNRKKTIILTELEQKLAHRGTKIAFRQALKSLIEEEILIPDDEHNPVKLYINREKINSELWEELRQKQLRWSGYLDLTWYFHHSSSFWQQEKIYLEEVFQYLQNGRPQVAASIWERSYEICNDEKWLTEKRGIAILKKIGVYERMQIIELPDPLMYSLNPQRLEDPVYNHLIIENKTTFFALSHILKETDLLTIIYGAGKKILGNISCLEKQLNLSHKQHRLFYFGDLDWEGIKIWSLLNKRRKTAIAHPFYHDLLKKEWTKSHTGQKKDLNALLDFQIWLGEEDVQILRNMLLAGDFLPQEALSSQELQMIVRQIKWRDI